MPPTVTPHYPPGVLQGCPANLVVVDFQTSEIWLGARATTWKSSQPLSVAFRSSHIVPGALCEVRRGADLSVFRVEQTLNTPP